MKKNKALIIGSRGSDLALWQANFVLSELKKIGIPAEIKIIKTQGDVVQLGWDKLEGKGFFTKEIEDALLNKEIDLAVHSHKDLPTGKSKGLIIGAVSEREDPSELLLINKNVVDEKEKFFLKKNARIGTSSARRKTQILAWREDVKVEDLRGNVPTRIQKLRDHKYDAVLIANAGVARLDLKAPAGSPHAGTSVYEEFCSLILSPKEFIPAPAQGVLAIQVREEDNDLIGKLKEINCQGVSETIGIERKILSLFEGGCQLPLGVYCEKEENQEGEMIYKVRVAKAENFPVPQKSVKTTKEMSQGISYPKYFYFESRKEEGFAERIVDRIKGFKPSSVFISRDEKRDDFLKKGLLASGCSVTFQSLIETKPVPFKIRNRPDWIFFSSKNAVKYFFSQHPEIGPAKLGAVGRATADEIRKCGKRAEFIGNSDDTRMTGKKFSALVGNSVVLFPQAKQSMKTIQLQLPRRENVIDIVVYETIKNPEFKSEDKNFEVLVFTSPSNVETFFEKNKINGNQKVVAMGDSTSNALRKMGVRANKMAPSFDDLGLLMAVLSL